MPPCKICLSKWDSTVSCEYFFRKDPQYIRSLGQTILNFSRIVPGGLLVFFPSYTVMRGCRDEWQKSDIWDKISKAKVYCSSVLNNEILVIDILQLSWEQSDWPLPSLSFVVDPPCWTQWLNLPFIEMALTLNDGQSDFDCETSGIVLLLYIGETHKLGTEIQTTRYAYVYKGRDAF